ncbi:MAG: hypothetical protein KDA78_08100 [Planctomycetaceae bacterium]|nr:hypothetical protein [Planctomycetaceae bacterium]
MRVSHFQQSSKKREPPQGFTLLELVLAAALSTLVLAGIGTLISIVYQVERTSQETLQLTEAGRNLLRQLEWDLQSIPGQMPAEEATGSSQSTAMTLALQPDILTSTVDTTVEQQPVLFYGTAVSLEFLAEPATRSGNEISFEVEMGLETLSGPVQQKLLIWSTTADLLSEQSGTTVNTEDLIARAEGAVDASLNITQLLSVLTYPELVSLEFAYFDGVAWYDEWDSLEMGVLPVAVEATVILQNPELEAAHPAVVLTRIIQIPASRFQEPTSGSLSGL